MIVSKHVQPSQSHTHISYPELARSRKLLASPPTTPPRGHKHSFSKPMSWLNRSSSSTSHHSVPRAAPKPTRISEPKMSSSLDQFGLLRSGPLGSGATIVRTPQEALSGSGRSVHRSNCASEDDEVILEILPLDAEKSEDRAPPRSSSPPLPPLPDVPDTEGGDRLSGSPPSISLSDHAPPPRSSSLPSQSTPSPRPTLVAHSDAPSRSTPALLPDPNPTPPQPPFEAIILSPIPDGVVDSSKFIITLETCTTTYRILLRSLASRSSHLSRYIMFLLSSATETASVYSNSSGTSSTRHSNVFSSFFRDHLGSSGCFPQSNNIHIFLDRPSAPYTHVLAYLRSLPSTPEHPETLPRAVQLGSTTTPSSSLRLESLFELRDEASYLGLVELEKLCSHEIRRFRCAAGSAHSEQSGSVQSFHTVVERSPSRQEVLGRPAEVHTSKGNGTSDGRTTKSTRDSSLGLSLENKDALVRERSRQGRGIKHEVGSPPPGWI